MPAKLKDTFFTEASLEELAAAVRAVHPRFPSKRFLGLVRSEIWHELELKARMRHVSLALTEVLPRSYARAVELLERAAPAVKGFEAMCLPDYVEVNGLDDWDRSLEALARFTRYSSSEFAIRPFLVADLDRTMAFMTVLAGHAHENVRRFSSEGCRPRLPWASGVPALKRDPAPILPILERLKDDPSEYVRRSVANNLNDISKDHPELVLDTAERWLGACPETDRVVKHACRTLLKRGDRRAMRLFGFGDPGQIRIERLRIKPARPRVGDEMSFTFLLQVSEQRACKIRLEYALHFVKKGGRLSRKVFQISERRTSPGEHAISKRHSFVDRSTRTHHAGEHRLEVIVNGVSKAERAFRLTHR